jgi:predicted nucleic acid-binding protein
VIVVDASVVVDALVGVLPDDVWDRLGDELAAPEIMMLEVCSAVARMVRHGVLDRAAAAIAIDELERLPIEILPVGHLIGRVFGLADRLSPYDASYVALAESEQSKVITSDGRLARAHGLPVPVVQI